MALPKKELVEVNGKEVLMSEAAFAIASKHFGARKVRLATKEIPIELRKAPPKLDIVPPKMIESEVDLSKQEVTVTATPVIKRTRRRK